MQTLTSNKAVCCAWAQQQTATAAVATLLAPLTNITLLSLLLQLIDCLEWTCHWGHVSLKWSRMRNERLADYAVNKILLGLLACDLLRSAC